jgi:uncharacterized protein (TIGR02145 family)
VLGYNDASGGTSFGIQGMVTSPEGYSGYFTGGKFRVESQTIIDSMLSMEDHPVSNLANPKNPRDAATKEYVDAVALWIYNLLTATTAETVRDASGNIYRTVKIGSQVWMSENLKTTKYNDGTMIPFVVIDKDWILLTTGAYCFYDELISNKNIYGCLYNWHAVNTGELCPTGWHVPSDADWTTLTTFLGGVDVAGGKMKETGFIHWDYHNFEATNESGFTALPGGLRTYAGNFNFINIYGAWWSFTELSKDFASYLKLESHHSIFLRGSNPKISGLSVRCLKD